MAGHRLYIQIEGSEVDRGHVRFSEFLQQLNAVRRILEYTAHTISIDATSNVYYRVVDLKHSSPATVVIEAVPAKKNGSSNTPGKEIIDTFVRTLSELKKHKVTSDEDFEILDVYRDLAAPIEKNVSRLLIRTSRQQVSLNKKLTGDILSAIGPADTEQGSISGHLESVTLRNRSAFNIYPIAGPLKVSCTFPDSLLDTIRSALGRRVTVYGELRFRSRHPFPYSIQATEIVVHRDDSMLPLLSAIRGIAPDATAGVPSEEFVRRLRDE